MCVGHSSASLNDETRALLDVGVCGVILRPPALSDAEKTAELIYSIKHYAARPVFLGVSHRDLEAADDRAGFSSLPLGSSLFRCADVELARHVGEVLGRELRSVGVDMTLGPCIDVCPDTLRQSVEARIRSGAKLFARAGAAFVEGQQSEGVAACVGHFPSRGDTRAQGEQDLSRLPHDISRLEEVELLPFRAAASARVAGMMVGHIVLGALDESASASLSRAIVFGLLRQKLGYRGLVMIDDVDAPALVARHSRATIARLGVASGADCFLCVRRPATALELALAIEKGVREGDILPERIEAARRRIAPLLHRYVRGADSTRGLDLAPIVLPGSHDTRSLARAGAPLDPGVDAASHVDPRSLAADKKQHHH